jgi:glutamate:GABA antiporter
VSFFPPDQLPVGSPAMYIGLVTLGIVVFGGVPLIIHHVRRSNWAAPADAPVLAAAAK